MGIFDDVVRTFKEAIDEAKRQGEQARSPRPVAPQARPQRWPPEQPTLTMDEADADAEAQRQRALLEAKTQTAERAAAIARAHLKKRGDQAQQRVRNAQAAAAHAATTTAQVVAMLRQQRDLRQLVLAKTILDPPPGLRYLRRG